MAKVIVTLGGVKVTEVTLDKPRTTIGRAKSNDIRLDDATVSGEHAVILNLQELYIEDLGSTNGTFLNGHKVNKRQIKHGDLVSIGQHELKFLDMKAQDFDATVIIQPEAAASLSDEPKKATLKILSGPKSGQTMELSKAHTTVGNPGMQVAVIARRTQGYFLLPVTTGDGTTTTKINNQVAGAASIPLQHGDLIEVAGTRLEFLYQ